MCYIASTVKRVQLRNVSGRFLWPTLYMNVFFPADVATKQTPVEPSLSFLNNTFSVVARKIHSSELTKLTYTPLPRMATPLSLT